MKDARGHGSDSRGSAAAHQAGVEAALRYVARADDNELVDLSRAQRAAIGSTQARMAAQQRGEAWGG
jgi:hypothetical protein